MGIEKTLTPWNIKINWSEWSYIRNVLNDSKVMNNGSWTLFWKRFTSFDYVIMIIDLGDEILEFANLVVVTLFFPFLPPWDIYEDLLLL